MRGRISLGAAVLAACAVSWVAVANAGLPTEIEIDRVDETSGSLDATYVAGHLTNPNPKCLAGRKVMIAFFYEGDGEPVPVDVDRSSKTGAFMGTGPSSSNGDIFNGARLAVTSKKIGPKHHRKICAAFQTEFNN
jgi:hypothetical protein